MASPAEGGGRTTEDVGGPAALSGLRPPLRRVEREVRRTYRPGADRDRWLRLLWRLEGTLRTYRRITPTRGVLDHAVDDLAIKMLDMLREEIGERRRVARICGVILGCQSPLAEW